MKLNNEFTVDVPVEDVWNVMLDLERITPCLPGASLTDETGEREYDGAMKVKLGPVTQQYKGTVKIQEADESAHRAVLRADGKDARGQGTASATIVSTLHDEGDGSTRVSVETDMQITGRAAQFGQGIQQQISEKLLARFADCLEEEITSGGAARGADVSGAPSANGSSGDGQAAQQGGGRQQEGVEALDLGEASRDAVMGQIKPAIPLVVGAVVLLLVIRSLGGGGSSGARSVESHDGFEVILRF